MSITMEITASLHKELMRPAATITGVQAAAPPAPPANKASIASTLHGTRRCITYSAGWLRCWA
ncbi:hypothetical protein AXF42_Ash002727 [Apostasia shenzhenica]|uniref:Uncharacterized protein n=1 Tax=Apostasia shenzhenica TaxID=1088818 RepID=A0A2I0A742_9ASPA|nr:hypothetical protein AXF42_Ash002727 [Apostasia shenzhenica]